jgi:hypothetical protein
VTGWALLLLIVYVALGLSRVGTAKAAQLSLVFTVLVVSTVVVRGGG